MDITQRGLHDIPKNGCGHRKKPDMLTTTTFSFKTQNICLNVFLEQPQNTRKIFQRDAMLFSVILLIGTRDDFTLSERFA